METDEERPRRESITAKDEQISLLKAVVSTARSFSYLEQGPKPAEGSLYYAPCVISPCS